MEGPGVPVGQECDVFDVMDEREPGRYWPADGDVDMRDVWAWMRAR